MEASQSKLEAKQAQLGSAPILMRVIPYVCWPDRMRNNLWEPVAGLELTGLLRGSKGSRVGTCNWRSNWRGCLRPFSA